MRRSNKILCAILVVVLLLGAVATAAFAANDSVANGVFIMNHQFPSKTSPWSDFEDKEVGPISLRSTLTTVANGQVVLVDGNKYVSFSNDAANDSNVSTASNNYTEFVGGTYVDNTTNNADDYLYGNFANKYIVIDMDFTAEKYISNVDGTLTDDAQTNGNDNYLAYPTALYLNSILRSGTSSTPTNPTVSFYLSRSGNQWYARASFNKVTEAKSVKLSTVAGEWNHFTLIWESDQTVNYVDTNGAVTTAPYDKTTIAAIDVGTHETYKSYTYNISNVKIHYVVNGEYLATIKPFGSDLDLPATWTAAGVDPMNLGHYTLRMQLAKAVVNGTFSYGIDNAYYRYYTNEYSGDFDTFMTAINAGENPDMTLVKDAPYNGNYDIPGNADVQSTVYEDADATEEHTVLTKVKDYEITSGALLNYTVGQYVYLNKSVANFVPHDNFYVACAEGETITLDPNSGYQISEEPVYENYYYVSKLSANTYVAVTWDINGKYVTETFPEGADISYEAPEFVKVEDKVNTYLAFQGWKYADDPDADEEDWIDMPEDMLLAGELYDFAMENYGALYLKAVYEEKVAEYFYIDALGNETAPAFDLSQLGLDIEAGKNVKLLSDVELQGPHDAGANATYEHRYYIVIDKSVSIDLNGYTLDLNLCTYGQAFTLGAGDQLTIYSSRENGKIVYSGALARANKSGSHVVLGRAGDKAEDNLLTVHVNSIFTTQNNPSTSAKPTVAIHGINFIRYNTTSKAATFTLYAPTTITINDSVFINDYTGSMLIGAGSIVSPNYPAVDATFNNSTVISVNADGAPDKLYSNIGDYSSIAATFDNKVVFNNCHVVGLLEASDAASAADPTFTYFKGGSLLSTTSDIATAGVKTDAGHVMAAYAGEQITLNYTNHEGEALSVAYTPNYVEKFNIKVNLTTNNGFLVNFYLPAELKGAVVTDAESNTVTGVPYNAEWTAYTVAVPAASVEDVIINISVIGEENYTAKISLITYFRTVMDTTSDDEAKALIVNAANYCNALYALANEGADYVPYTSIVTANQTLVITPDANELTAVKDVISTTVITDAQLMISAGNIPMFAFTKANDATVTVEYIDIYGEAKVVTATVIDGYYVVEEMSVYEMLGTINVYADGDKVLVYSLADYIKSTGNDVAEALWGYAQAAKAYKVN